MALKRDNQNSSRMNMNSSWFKNVAKSLGFGAADLMKDTTPASYEFASTNAETVREIISEIKNAKTLFGKISGGLQNVEQLKIVADAFKNAKSDLRSGKLYNNERLEAMYESEMMGDDFEDFSFSDDDFEDSSSSPKGKPSAPEIAGMTAAPIVKALNNQTEAIVNTADATTKASIALATQQMLFDRKIGDSINNGLTNINNNLSSLVNFQNDSMSKYIGASIKYYDESIGTMRSQLDEIKKMTAGIVEKKDKDRKEFQSDNIFGSSGTLDLKAYMGAVGQNFKKAAEEDFVLSNIMNVFKDTSTLKYMAANPLMFVATKMASAIMPSALKMTMQSVDKTFAAFFPALLMKINRLKETNPALGLISDVFGVRVDSKSSARLDNYERGAISFDGETKKAITEIIPTYLRKILAAVSGKEEMGFDYREGKFKSIYKMTRELQDSSDRASLSSFDDTMGIVNDVLGASNKFTNSEVKKEVDREIKNFFRNLSTKRHLINPDKKVDSDGGVVDELKDVYSFSNQNLGDAVNKIIRNLPKNVKMDLFGRQVIEANKNRYKFYDDIERNPNDSNYSSVKSWERFDEHIDRNKKDDSKYTASKQYDMFTYDKFGKKPTDYLRDITKILLTGIRVFPMGGMSQNSKRRGRITTTMPDFERQLTSMEGDETSASNRSSTHRTGMSADELDTERDRARSEGRDLIEDMSDIDTSRGAIDEAIYNQLQAKDDKKSKESSSVLKWLGKYFKGDKAEKYEMMRTKLEDYMKKPIDLVRGIFDRVDTTMYSVIFGNQGEDSKGSYFRTLFDSIKSNFTEFNDWLKKDFYLPLKELLIGKDGIFTGMKNSELFGKAKNFGTKMMSYLFGDAAEDGSTKLEGGLFNSVGNEFMDMWKGFKYYFDGKSYGDSKGAKYPKNDETSVFSHVRNAFSSFTSNVKSYFFGNKDSTNPDEKQGIMTKIGGSLHKGFSNFYDLIFGHEKLAGGKDTVKQTYDEFKNTIKERMPKALATGLIGGGAGLLLGGKLGLLGSLFLPGGPIGGAIVGTTIGFLSQSNKFKDWLFGKQDSDTGERMGGYIGKSTQDFFKKNKVGIIGGATVGAAKSVLGFGLLPSFFLPGGPIGGALLGAGVSMLARSEKVKNMLFGKEDAESGEKIGGLFNKIFSKIKGPDGENTLGNMGAGAIGGATLGLVISKFGLLGSLMLPGGPLGGAILGAASGILISSTKWRERLFGKTNDDTGLREGGLFGKLINWTNMELLEPLKLKFREIKLNMGEWFEKSIKNPFLEALEPMKEMFRETFRNMKEMFKAGWTDFKDMIGGVFEKFVGAPFGKFMRDNVMDPMKKFLNRLVSGMGKIFGSILSSPIKALSYITGSYQKGREESSEESWRGGKKFGKKGILYGIKARVFGRYDDEDRAELESRRNADMPYREGMIRDSSKRDRTTSLKYAIGRRNLNEDIADYKERQRIQRLKGYDDTVSIDGMDPIKSRSILQRIRDGLRRGPKGASPATTPQPSGSVIRMPGAVGTGPVIHLPGTVEGQQSSMFSPRVNNMLLLPPGRGPASDGATVSNGAIPDEVKGAKAKTSSDQLQSGVPNAARGTAQGNTGKGRTIDTGSYIKRIADDVRIIRTAVEGQLNGVGWNINAIKNMLRKKFGFKEGEGETEPTNKVYKTFWSKVADLVKKPFTFIGNKFKDMGRWFGDKVKAVGDFFNKIWNGVKDAGKALVDGIIWTGKSIITAATTLIRIPFEIVKGAASLVISLGKMGVDITKNIAPLVAKGLMIPVKLLADAGLSFGNVLRGAGHAAYESLKGFGKGVGEILLGMGSMIGSSFKTLGLLIKGAAPAIVDVTKKTISTVADLSIKTLNTVTDALFNIGKGVMDLITSPFKFISRSMAKMLNMGEQRVIVVGGTLDTVKVVERIGPRVNKKGPKMSPISSVFKSTSRSPMLALPPGSSSNMLALPPGLMEQATFSALQRHDDDDDIEEERKATDREEENALSEQEESTKSKGAASTLKRLFAEKKEKLKAWSNELKQTSLLEKLLGVNKDQRKDWMGIFGKAGLITTAVILGLPLIAKFLENIKDFFGRFLGGNKDPGDAPNASIIESTGRVVFNKLFRPGVKRVIAKPISEALFNKFTKGSSKGVVNKAGRAITRGMADGAERTALATADAAFGNVERVVLKNPVSKGGMLDDIIKFFKKVFASDAIKKRMGGSSVAGKVLKKITGILKKLFSMKSISRYTTKLKNGVIKTGAKITGGVLSAGIITAAFATFDALTGQSVTETARTFGVNDDRVDGKMRSISALYKVLAGILPILSILIEVIADLMGFDFKQMLVTYIYNASDIVSAEDKEALESSQGDFEDDWNAYNETNQTNISKSEYNNMVNKTVMQKAWGAVTNSKFGKNFAVGSKALWDGTKAVGRGIATGAKFIGGGISKGAGAAWSGIKSVGRGIATGAKFIGGGISKGAGAAWSGIKSVGGKVADMFSEESARRNLGVGDNYELTRSQRVSSTLGNLLSTATGGLLGSAGTTKFIQGAITIVGDVFEKLTSGIKAIWDGIKKDWKEKVSDPAKQLWIDFKTGFAEVWDTFKLGWDTYIATPAKNLWDSAVTSWKENISDPAKELWASFKDGWKLHVTDPASKVWTDIKDSAIGAFNYIKDILSKPWNWVKEKANETYEGAKDTITGTKEVITNTFSNAYNWVTDRGSKETYKEYIDGYNKASDKIAYAASLRKQGVPESTILKVRNFTYEGGNGSGKIQIGGGYGERNIKGFPYYSQYDERWQSKDYNTSKGQIASTTPTIGKRGCGPTAMAMVVSHLTGRDTTPETMADLSKSMGTSVPAGTSWNFMTEAPSRYGFQGTQAKNVDEAIEMLKQGYPIILSGKSPEGSLASSSPFTQGGHFVVGTGIENNKILINDPRGESFSKGYDIQTVKNQTKGAWWYKGDNMPALPTRSDDSDGSSTSEMLAKYLSDIAGASTFSTPVGDLISQLSKVSLFGDISNSSYDLSNVDWSNSSSKLDQGKMSQILKKVLETTKMTESSGKYDLVANDTNSRTKEKISPSIGILQWRGPKAKELFNMILRRRPNDTKAKYYANVDWNDDRPWSPEKIADLKNYLQSIESDNRAVQDEYATNHIKNTNLEPVLKYGYNSGKIRDPRALAFLADFANTGPAHVKNFLDKYTAYDSSSGTDEFDHFLNEFKTKSHWGTAAFDYSGRIKTLKGELKDWDLGGFGRGPSNLMTYRRENLVPRTRVNYDPRMISPNKSGDSDKLLNKVISVLNDISGHSEASSSNLKEFANKGLRLDIKTEGNVTNTVDRNTGVNSIIVAGGNSSNPIQQNNVDANSRTTNKNYKTAATIAKGRLY